MNNPQPRSTLLHRLLRVIRIALCAAAFLGFADSLRAGDSFSYTFVDIANSAETESDVTISFEVSARDDGSYSAVYSHRDWIHQTLTDVKAVRFKRRRVLTASESGAFFASLADAGLWKLPEGDNFIGNGPSAQIYATISGRDQQRCYNSPIEDAVRISFHTAVLAFAKKLGLDQPQDLVNATHTVEGDRTPAREVPFSSLITNAARYDGQRISVAGFYHAEFECSVLVPGKFDWHGLDSNREFWVEGPSKFNGKSEISWKNDSWVRIEGVFSAHYGGHMGMSPGVIERITKFTSLDAPPNPAALSATAEDDPHAMEKLMHEIQIQPFPMDGRPIQEVVTALNQQIGNELTKRGLAADWLKIELDSESNPKARVAFQIKKPELLRTIVGILGVRITPGDNAPFGDDRGAYTYVLPNVIQLRVKTSPYSDDKEPISFREVTFGQQAVRAKLVRSKAEWRGPDTFRVKWHSDLKPEDTRLSEALEIIHSILPDEPGAKSITSIYIEREDTGWLWSADTEAVPQKVSPVPSLTPVEPDDGAFFGSPISTFAKRRYAASVDAKSVDAAPPWNFEGKPPLELDAAIRAARATLREIPNAEASLQLDAINLASLGDNRSDFTITFRDPFAGADNFLTIPVLLSGKAITPKPYPNPGDEK